MSRKTACACEHRDWHSPSPLARDAPVGTVGDHVPDADAAGLGKPAHFLDGLKGLLPQIPKIQRNEPLIGGAEDHRVATAPAMRVRMSEDLSVEQ